MVWASGVEVSGSSSLQGTECSNSFRSSPLISPPPDDPTPCATQRRGGIIEGGRHSLPQPMLQIQENLIGSSRPRHASHYQSDAQGDRVHGGRGSRGNLGGRRGASDSACVHLPATPLTPLEFPLLPLADGPPLLAFFLHMPSPSAASHTRRSLLEGHTDRSLVRHLQWQHGPDQPGGEGFVTC